MEATLVCVLRGLPGEVTFELRPEEYEGAGQGKIWEQRIPGRGISKCKGPETGLRLGVLEAPGQSPRNCGRGEGRCTQGLRALVRS